MSAAPREGNQVVSESTYVSNVDTFGTRLSVRLRKLSLFQRLVIECTDVLFGSQSNVPLFVEVLVYLLLGLNS